jgi:COMPASS component SWD3
MAYKEDDPNVVVTGGWDKTLQIHDIRKGGPVGYIFGPDLSSNAIDIHDNVIVTGSHRGRNPLQTFDIRKKELIQTLEWDYSGEVSESSYLNCVNISHSGDMIFGGGKGEELKFFELDDNGNYTMIGKQSGFKDTIL